MKQLFYVLISLLYANAYTDNNNPFESIGKQGKIITLSQGQYVETYSNDSLQRIGSVIMNMNTGKVYGYMDEDEAKPSIDPQLLTRFYTVDPLQAKFASQSPYLFAGNNPVLYVDEEGKKKTVYLKIIDEQTGKTIISKGTVVSSALMSQRNIHSSTVPALFGGTYTSKTVDYNWYDIDQINTLTLKKDGTAEFSIGKETRGKFRTNTNGSSVTWAKMKSLDILIPEKGTNNEGGDVFTSSSGAGEDNKYEPGANHIDKITNIDALLTLIGGVSNGKGFDMSNTLDRMEALNALSGATDKIYEAFSVGNDLDKIETQSMKKGVYDKATKKTWADSMGRNVLRNGQHVTDTIDTKDDNTASTTSKIHNKLRK